jgi:hypothetical protein
VGIESRGVQGKPARREERTGGLTQETRSPSSSPHLSEAALTPRSGPVGASESDGARGGHPNAPSLLSSVGGARHISHSSHSHRVIIGPLPMSAVSRDPQKQVRLTVLLVLMVASPRHLAAGALSDCHQCPILLRRRHTSPTQPQPDFPLPFSTTEYQICAAVPPLGCPSSSSSLLSPSLHVFGRSEHI